MNPLNKKKINENVCIQPKLFKSDTEAILRKLEVVIGSIITGPNLMEITYADNIVFITKTERKLQNSYKKLLITKTKHSIRRKDPPTFELRNGYINMKEVQEFRSDLAEDGICGNEI